MDYKSMEKELRDSFLNNRPIKVNLIENGRIIVKEISPDSIDYSEMYSKQSQFLREKINGSSVQSVMHDIKAKVDHEDEVNQMMNEIMGSIEEKNHQAKTDIAQSKNSPDLSKIDSDIVVVKKENIIYIIGEIEESDLEKLNSSLYNRYKNNSETTVIICNTRNHEINKTYQTKAGLRFRVDAKKRISVLGEFDEIEHINNSSIDSKISVKKILEYARNGYKSGLTALIVKYGMDNIWINISDGLKKDVITNEQFDEFVRNLSDMYSKEECKRYNIFNNKYFKELQKGIIAHESKTEPLSVLSQDEIDHEAIPSKAGRKAQKVKSRKKANESLKNKFFSRVSGVKEWWGGLSPRTKGIIIGSVIAVVGVGLIVLNAEAIKNFIDGLNNPIGINNHLSTPNIHTTTTPINQVHEQMHNVIDNIKDTINSVQNASVNFDVIGEGNIGYSSAADAINGSNGVILNSFFGQGQTTGITDVYNASTGWMHLTEEQLSNPQFLKTLSEDPNNAIHIKDAWFNLSDIIGEIIKGGKVL